MYKPKTSKSWSKHFKLKKRHDPKVAGVAFKFMDVQNYCMILMTLYYTCVYSEINLAKYTKVKLKCFFRFYYDFP